MFREDKTLYAIVNLLVDADRDRGDASDGANETRPRDKGEGVAIASVRMVHHDGRDLLEGSRGEEVERSQLDQRAVAPIIKPKRLMRY